MTMKHWTKFQAFSIGHLNKRPRGHIAHLSHRSQFFLYTLSLEAMALYETHFCIWTGSFYVNLNSSGAADLEIFFYNLALKNTPVAVALW
jgi:hypothetical protein